MSETPRTDAQTLDTVAGAMRCPPDVEHAVVDAAFARELERENESLIEQVRGMEPMVDQLQRDNAALRSLLREALDLIDPYDMPQAQWVIDRITAALEEAQP